MHALLEATGEGHCALPKEVLIERAAKLLEIDVAIVREALERLLLDGELVYEPIGGHDLIYLPYFEACRRWHRLLAEEVGWRTVLLAANRC